MPFRSPFIIDLCVCVCAMSSVAMLWWYRFLRAYILFRAPVQGTRYKVKGIAFCIHIDQIFSFTNSEGIAFSA